MDKNNAGEQLNRAFEAYRQACMERDNIKKTLEQKICALEQELATLKNTIEKLQLQSVSATPRGNNPGQGQVLNTRPQIKEGDLLKMRRSEPQHTVDPSDELKIALETEKYCKEQLETENSRLKEQIKDYQQKQKELKRDIEERDHELRQLRKELKEDTDFFIHGKQLYCTPDLQVNWKTDASSSKKDIPFSGTDHHPLNKDSLDFAFQEVCQEFEQLSALTKKQTELLRIYNYNKKVIDMPFSMPIQCTDEEHEHVEEHFVGKDKSMSKRVIGTQSHRLHQEKLPVVESLSDLDVKFPPSDNDYDFLNSTPEKLRSKTHFEDPTCKDEEVLLKDDPQNLEQKNKEECTLFETFTVGPSNNAAHPFCDEQGKSTDIHTSIGATVDKTTFRGPPTLKPSSPFLNVESHQMVRPASTEIRGPQQPVWNPYHNKEGELLHQPSKDSDLDLNSKICEFCQTVFPAGPTSREDFLRHLNSHFEEDVKNGS